MLINGLNDDVMKNIFSYLPKVPKDGTDDDREFKKWLLTKSGKEWNAMDGQSKSVHRIDDVMIKKGYINERPTSFYSSGLTHKKILKWFINEKGDLDNKYVLTQESIWYNNNCCIKCGKPHHHDNPRWKTECYLCYSGNNLNFGNCMIESDED